MIINRLYFIFPKLWYLLLCSTLGIALPAQDINIDSLQQLIDTAPNEYTKVKETTTLAHAITIDHPFVAKQSLLEILPLAQSLDDKIVVEVYYFLGEVYEATQQLDSALIVYDKVIALAQQYSVPDRRINSLIQQGFIYAQKGDLNKCLELAKAAYALAANNTNNAKMRAANNLGRSFSFIAEFDSSTYYLKEAIEVEQALSDNKRIIAELHINIGNNYARSQKIDQAIEAYNEALDLMKEAKDSTRIAVAYRSIAVTYFFSGAYPEALENLHTSVDILANTKYYVDHIKSLDYLGEIYFTIKDYENAQLYWERAIETSQKANVDQQNPDLLFKKGRVLLLQEKYQEALEVLLLSEELMKEMGQHISGDWYWHIGQAHEMLEDYEKAQQNYERAIELAPGVNSQFIITRSLFGLGQVQEKQGKYDQALSYYEQAYDVAFENGLKENEMDAAAGLYRMYKRKSNSNQALYFHEISKSIQDSLFNEANTEEITRMQSRFEFEQEKQELAYAQAEELKEQLYIRRLLWIALAVAAILLIIGLLYNRAKQKSNERLGLLNEQILSQKEKLEELDISKSHFFTNISHEFRTPLTVIIGMIAKAIKQPEKWDKNEAEVIDRNAKNLLDLVNQILDLRKLESGKLALNLYQADIIPHLRYIFDSFNALGGSKNIKTHYDSDLETLVMDYDSEKMLRIISNLMSNAIKFTPEEGNIYLSITKGKAEQYSDTEDELIIKVKDTGIGIPPEKLEKIFDQFYQMESTSKWAGHGTGIGLALCKELVELMGGDIKVESEVGHGSIFTVSLPVYRRAPIKEVIEMDELTVDSAYARVEEIKHTDVVDVIDEQSDLPLVLLIDDNRDILQYLMSCLEGKYQLAIARDGQEGIDKALELIPDVIISDVMMPKKNGYEVCDELKANEKTSHIPIILLTAKASDHSKIEGLKKGADVYLTKPFQEEELLIRLHNIIKSRKKTQQYFLQNNKLSASNAQNIDEEQENEFLQRLRDLLIERLDDNDYGIPEICRDIGMSRSQLHRKIKALTGLSTSFFLRRIRLFKAKELLETTDLNISQVTYTVGVSNPSYFARIFVEEFGYAPSNIRK
ncbi:MAG: tetratricopeptide repeat protein [Chitinophagales bacterium]|nr:tetratricopeptide repeat protein [Chitinophagales bacterium]